MNCPQADDDRQRPTGDLPPRIAAGTMLAPRFRHLRDRFTALSCISPMSAIALWNWPSSLTFLAANFFEW